MPVYVVRGDYFQFNQYNHSGWVAYVEPHNLAWQATSVRLSAAGELVGFLFSTLSNQYSLVAI